MNKINISKLLLALMLIASTTLTSCANYRASALNNLSPDLIACDQTMSHDGVFISAKTFNKNDCKKYLDRDVIGYGYYPVQLYIENNSDKNYRFALSRVSLPCASPEEVAAKAHTSTVGRATGYGAAALLIWPFVIPAIVDGVKSANANAALDRDFDAKTAKDHMIYQHSHSNMLMFVPSNSYQPSFTVTLIDQETNQTKTFRVNSTS